MKHYYRNVPRLGNVALSRHAQARAEEQSITDEMVERCLLHGYGFTEGLGILRLVHHGVVLIIQVRPTPFKGAKLVTTIFREMQTKLK